MINCICDNSAMRHNVIFQPQKLQFDAPSGHVTRMKQSSLFWQLGGAVSSSVSQLVVIITLLALNEAVTVFCFVWT